MHLRRPLHLYLAHAISYEGQKRLTPSSLSVEKTLYKRWSVLLFSPCARIGSELHMTGRATMQERGAIHRDIRFEDSLYPGGSPQP